MIIEEESNFEDFIIKELLNSEGRKIILMNGIVKTQGQSKFQTNLIHPGNFENYAVRIILKKGNLNLK